jgi:uncharacterized protein (UPF0333 family)
MFKRGMDSRGQLSVEYLLLLVVIFVVFGAMITYLIGPSIDSANDISDVSGASNTINSIANAINIVYANGPGSKRSLKVYIPDSMTIIVNSSGVCTNVPLSNGSVKTIIAPLNGPADVWSKTITKGNRNAVIIWYNNTKSISWNVY